MKMKAITAILAGFALAASAAFVPIEDFQFNDPAGTSWGGLSNSAGSAMFVGNMTNVVTTGPGGTPAGALEFTQGGNSFRNATLTTTNRTTGTYQLEFRFLTADLRGPDLTGANTGFGFRSNDGTDLFLVRLQEQNNTLRLQTRISGSNVGYFDFGTNVLEQTLAVRAVADLDNDLLDLFYTIGAGSELTAATNIAIVDAPFDILRSNATLRNDFSPSDVITVDYLTLSVPEPGTMTLMGVATAGLFLARNKSRPEDRIIRKLQRRG
jgi:hypothetical protein